LTATAAPPTDQAMYERMIAAVRDHRLPPGTKLIEDKLAAAFGVSRTRVRPVLVRLANEQVVTLVPNRGATITQPSRQEAHEVFEARRLIEPRLVELFIARAGKTDLAALQRCIADEEAARLAGDARRAIRLAGDFHLQIGERSGHQTLGRVLRELTARTSLVLMAYSPTPTADHTAGGCRCDEHRTLLAAIRLGDAAEAGRRMCAHLSRLESQLRFDAAVDTAPDLGAMFAGAAG
jgi:DNA-binding GntR family transcriptional regulator